MKIIVVSPLEIIRKQQRERLSANGIKSDTLEVIELLYELIFMYFVRIGLDSCLSIKLL